MEGHNSHTRAKPKGRHVSRRHHLSGAQLHHLEAKCFPLLGLRQLGTAVGARCTGGALQEDSRRAKRAPSRSQQRHKAGLCSSPWPQSSAVTQSLVPKEEMFPSPACCLQSLEGLCCPRSSRQLLPSCTRLSLTLPNRHGVSLSPPRALEFGALALQRNGITEVAGG